MFFAAMLVEEIWQGRVFDRAGGWMPAGRGVLVETITLTEDGQSYHSTIRYDAFDQAGKPTETGSTSETVATRMRF